MIRPIFLRMCLTDMLKMPPYAKYMKDIVTNKRKIPEAEISTMLDNYTFKGGIPKKLGDLGVPTIPCSIKTNYVKTALCDFGAGVSVMPFSFYHRLDLSKLTPTEISLQMADKSTAIPIGICGDVHAVVEYVTDTSILHHALISIFIALWAVITRYVTILMPILSYFTRFTQGGRMPAAGILGWKRSKY